RPAPPAGAPRPGLPRRAFRVREERAVPAPAAAAFRDHQAVAVLQHLAERDAGLGLAGLGAARHADLENVAVLAGAVAGAAVGAALGAELGVVAEREQRVLVRDREQHHVAAAAAHAAVRTAARPLRPAAEAHAAVAAVSAFDEDLDLVDEHPLPPGAPGRGRIGPLTGGRQDGDEPG